MGVSATIQKDGTKNNLSLRDGMKKIMSLTDELKKVQEKERKRYEVPEGKTAGEYKALAQKFSGKYKELVDSTNRILGNIHALNYKQSAQELRDIANKEGFENTNPYIGGCENLLARKNEQICALIVTIIVLITAFIILGCYMFMRGSVSTSGTNEVTTETTYRP